MSRHVGLASRVKRAEKRRLSRRQRPAIILTIAGQPNNAIVGFGAVGGEPVSRLWGENLSSLASRARADGAPRLMVAAYPPAAPVEAPVAPPPPLPKALLALAFDRSRPWTDYRKELARVAPR